VKPRRPFGLRTAFGSTDQKQAFGAPTMGPQDLAFASSVPKPQDAATLPTPTLPPGG
jgi:hypothetical protein